MNVMLVEDDAAFRRGFAKLICAEPDFNLMGAATSLAEARRCMSAELPDVLLVDLGLPDGDGIDLIREVYERSRCVNTMVVSVFGDEQHVFRSLEAGATGYLLKDAAPDEIITSIRNLVAGGSPISPVIARKLLTRLLSPMGTPGTPGTPGTAGTAGNAISAPEKAAAPLDHGPFSDREYEILCIIARGFRSDEIARMLSISTHTVISHVKNIYQKLAVHSRAEAVFEARQMGLLD